MGANILKHWDAGQLDLTANTKAYLVIRLRGGESVTIKAKAANTGIVYLGPDNNVRANNGFDVSKGEVATFTLPLSFGVNNYIEIWAYGATAGDDVAYFLLVDDDPSTAASSK